jgi:hypothetical protein
MSAPQIPPRPASVAAAVGGALIAVLAALALIAPTSSDGPAWFLVAAGSAALIAFGTAGLRAAVRSVPRTGPPLLVAVVGLALFALAHVYTLVDLDTALLLFSVFMIVGSLGLVVAGVFIARAWHGLARFVPLLCGLWPIATIPVGAALGDVPHFGAIALWGVCWIALGATLRGPARDRVGAGG